VLAGADGVCLWGAVMRDVSLRTWNCETDLDLVARMALRFILETQTGRLMGGEPSPERVRAGIQVINAGVPGTVILAHDSDGVPVGFAALLLVENVLTGGAYVEEYGIWVEPEARHDTNAGVLLIAASENWTQQVGATVLKMAAPPRSGFARWLRHQGYELVEEALIKRF
jgi:hypothetical protein